MEIVTTIAPIALAIIMFGLGLGLALTDFLRVLKIPKDFLVGFICQVILLPIIALFLVIVLVGYSGRQVNKRFFKNSPDSIDVG